MGSDYNAANKSKKLAWSPVLSFLIVAFVSVAMHSLQSTVNFPEYPLLSSFPEHLRNNCFVVMVLMAADHGCIRVLCVGKLGQDKGLLATWFFVHALANSFVVLTSINSMLSVMRDPLHAMDVTVNADRSFFGNASRWPLTVISSVHV